MSQVFFSKNLSERLKKKFGNPFFHAGKIRFVKYSSHSFIFAYTSYSFIFINAIDCFRLELRFSSVLSRKVLSRKNSISPRRSPWIFNTHGYKKVLLQKSSYYQLQYEPKDSVLIQQISFKNNLCIVEEPTSVSMYSKISNAKSAFYQYLLWCWLFWEAV